MKNLALLFLSILFAFTPVKAQEIDIISNVKIKMRDGILLNATIYKPHLQKESLPVILQITPYISDGYHDRASYFSKNEFVYAIVDSRGRGNSEGVFDPFIQEANDGFDVVEWLASQKYCNGKVAMWGGSYSGYNQWATAKEFPPHLKTIVPVASVKPGIDFPMFNNIYSSYFIQWLTFTSGKTGNQKLFGDSKFWDSKFKERYMKDLPYTCLDSLVGNPNTTFQKWISHSSYDNFYKSMSPSESQFRKIDMPILTITGHYDGDQHGALSHYNEFMLNATTSAKNKHYLVIGPWDHPGTRTPREELGGLIFGDSSIINMNDFHKQWYNFAMKDKEKPAFLKNKVAYFVSNKNKWKYASTLDEVGKEKLSFYLNSGNNSLNDIHHSAFLQKNIPTASKPIEIVYDPLDKTNGEKDVNSSENYMTDQTYAMNLGNSAVIYHTEPFEQETEVSGFFDLKLYIETDVKDVDISAGIYEVRPNGTSVFLTSTVVRAKHKDNISEEKLLVPGEVNLFNFNKFRFISRSIEKGSRIRLIISDVNSINSQKNYCSGGIVNKETVKDAHIAHIKIHNSSKYPSTLSLPLGKN